MRFRQSMISLLGWLWACALFAGVGVGVTALFSWVLGEHRPLWTGAVWGASMFLGMCLLSYAGRRGWIQGVFWNRENREELERRQNELTADLERSLREARAKTRD